MTVGRRWNGGRALVTGASAGIGAAFAHLLAAAGCNLILTARRKDRLEELKKKLLEQYNIKVDLIIADLSSSEGVQKVFTEASESDSPLDLLINNAGFGYDGHFCDTDWEIEAAMIRLNVMSPLKLTKLFLPEMKAQQKGDILFVSSIAAFTPVPTMSVYAATKAFLTSFGESLGDELRGSGIRATVVNPGGTMTEFASVAGMKATKLAEKGSMSAEDVARIGLKAMERGKRSVITGVMNSIMMWISSRLLPLTLRLKAAKTFHVAGGGKG